MIRLLIADDHAALRRGLAQLFALSDDIRVVAQAADADEALRAVAGNELDLALLDLSMPGPSGVELIRRIRVTRPGLPLLVLSMHSEPQIVQHALRAGAQGYLVKGCDEEHIVDAVRRAAAAGVPSRWPPWPQGAEVLQGLLSPFGARVAALLQRGFAPDSIARSLGVREETVRRCMAGITPSGATLTLAPDNETEEDDGPRAGR